MTRSRTKPHIFFSRGAWWCEVYRQGRRSGVWFKSTQWGLSVVEVWNNFLVWPGL